MDCGCKDTYPDIQIQILVCDRLDVESDCRNRCHDFPDLQGHWSESWCLPKNNRSPVLEGDLRILP